MIQADLQIDHEFATKVNGNALIEAIQETLRQQGVERADVTLVITNDEQVQELNRTFRNVDSPTDILSFPNHEAAVDNVDSDDALPPRLIVPPDLVDAERSYLGDLIIAFPYTQRQAIEHQRSLDAELMLLVIHGTLHLLGYDHAGEDDRATMWALQNQVLTALDQAPIAP